MRKKLNPQQDGARKGFSQAEKDLMRNEFAKHTVDWVGVRSGASLALRFRCATPAPLSILGQTMDQTLFKVT